MPALPGLPDLILPFASVDWRTVLGGLREAVGLSNDTVIAAVQTLCIAVLYFIGRRALRRTIDRRVDEAGRRYILSKTAHYAAGVVALLIIAKIWLADQVHIATYLGILSAGLAVALQDPISDLAGWLFILVRQPFQVGDRIQIGPISGDVVDVGLFTFSMLEIGGWVDGEQSTGRLVHLPNGRVFKEALANYTAGFEYIWHEMPVMITFESDWRRARVLLQAIADEHSEQVSDKVQRQLQRMTTRYMVTYTHLTPIVWVSVADSGVVLTIRTLCRPRQRRGTSHAIWEAILDTVACEPTIDFAYPTQRFYDNRSEGKPGAKPGPPPPPPGATITVTADGANAL